MILPAGHRVLVKPDPIEERTKGGLIIPETTKVKDQNAQVMGTVVRIGPSAWKAWADGDPWASVGDRVYYAMYAGGKVTEDGEELRLMNDEDITAVVK